MQRRVFIKNTGLAGIITMAAPSLTGQPFSEINSSKLEQDFLTPPGTAYPQTFWFWMNGNVSKEGITLDLEAMKEVGIGGVFNFDVGTGIPKGPVEYLSEEWLALKKHAIAEAGRLGLEFTMHNCPGWSASGGPWITPELAMQQITWSEAYVQGGKHINQILSKPPNRLNYYNDLVVLAFPSLEGEAALQTVKGSTGNGPVDSKQITGESPEAIVVRPANDHELAYLQFEFSGPYTARTISFFIGAVATENTINLHPEFSERTSVKLEASDDGIQFNLVTQINTGLEGELLMNDKYITYDIPVTTAKYFRLSSKQPRLYRQVHFSGITRLKNWMEKSNSRGAYISNVEDDFGLPYKHEQEVPAASIIDADAILDISSFMNKDGLLQWDGPAGNWTIMRIGFTTTGTMIRSAPDTGMGLECDKFSRHAFEFHFNKMMERILPLITALSVKGKMGLEIDSYEAGAQNWTTGFEKEFLKRWGYNLLKYLPAVAGGRIVDSVNITERFLWNFRRLQADMMADNYYGCFNELCHEHGITSYIEPYDQGPMEEMQIGSRVDVNMGEFWNGYSSSLPVKHPVRRTLKLAASIAHINGQKITGAEAFTADPDSGRWQEYPFAMKAAGDKAFIKGVNKLIIHRFAHQPNTHVFPGMTMGPWGIHFDRTTTWWKQGKAWLDYLARCQSLLQQGSFVADLVYFTGENANMYTKVNADELNPQPPAGYDYDLINAEVFFKKVKIINGSIVLEDGMVYRIFVLQRYEAISLSLLQKLRDLVLQGMLLVGAKPGRSLGLENYSGDDSTFKQIASELWGEIDGTSITENSFGKGKVYWGIPLKSLLQSLNIDPDFEISSRSGDAPINYTHRKINDTDIYFITNQRRSYEDIVCTFRVNNKQPELWDAVTGNMIHCSIYEKTGSRMRVPLQLEPYGSVFVAFRSPASVNSLHALLKENIPLLSSNGFVANPRKLYKEVTNNFTICVWAKPEINVLLNPSFIMGTIKNLWTDYYAIYPANSKQLYGDGHATCGLTIGRNGIVVWENNDGNPDLILAAETPVSGWSHIALIYKNGIPSVFLNGKLIKEGKAGNNIVHPGLGEAYFNEGASYYNGDMNEPVLFAEILNEEKLLALVAKGKTQKTSPAFAATMFGNPKPALLIRENGAYSLHYNSGKLSGFQISGIDDPLIIDGTWDVYFPPGLGTPPHIILSQLISLHTHTNDAIKYFSGTCIYKKHFTLAAGIIKKEKRFFLDLGSVEVIAEIAVNGKDFGILWKRPYTLDITGALITGINKLEIKITNLWPNRLIGDEQLPDAYKYTPGGGSSGLAGITGGGIEAVPDWYTQNKQKPNDGRICFTTWKHYTKDSPLLESGLIGPVVLQTAILKLL